MHKHEKPLQIINASSNSRILDLISTQFYRTAEKLWKNAICKTILMWKEIKKRIQRNKCNIKLDNDPEHPVSQWIPKKRKKNKINKRLKENGDRESSDFRIQKEDTKCWMMLMHRGYLVMHFSSPSLLY